MLAIYLYLKIGKISDKNDNTRIFHRNFRIALFLGRCRAGQGAKGAKRQTIHSAPWDCADGGGFIAGGNLLVFYKRNDDDNREIVYVGRFP